MNISLDGVKFERGGWMLKASGTFGEGVHLISGMVGSGKSTLSLILGGLLAPGSGSVTTRHIESRMVSMQFPEYHLTATTIYDEVASWGINPDSLLTTLDLTNRGSQSPFSLSRGELKRLHLECVLASEWDLLVLDEPFSSLDCVQKKHLCTRIEKISHGIIVILTHEQDMLPRVDEIWEMESGQLEWRGKIPEALSSWKLAPPFILLALEEGSLPQNVRAEDAREALCRIRD